MNAHYIVFLITNVQLIFLLAIKKNKNNTVYIVMGHIIYIHDTIFSYFSIPIVPIPEYPYIKSPILLGLLRM